MRFSSSGAAPRDLPETVYRTPRERAGANLIILMPKARPSEGRTITFYISGLTRDHCSFILNCPPSNFDGQDSIEGDHIGIEAAESC